MHFCKSNRGTSSWAKLICKVAYSLNEFIMHSAIWQKCMCMLLNWLPKITFDHNWMSSGIYLAFFCKTKSSYHFAFAICLCTSPLCFRLVSLNLKLLCDSFVKKWLTATGKCGRWLAGADDTEQHSQQGWEDILKPLYNTAQVVSVSNNGNSVILLKKQWERSLS